jgi:hypothetical protein
VPPAAPSIELGATSIRPLNYLRFFIPAMHLSPAPATSLRGLTAGFVMVFGDANKRGVAHVERADAGISSRGGIE